MMPFQGYFEVDKNKKNKNMFKMGKKYNYDCCARSS